QGGHRNLYKVAVAKELGSIRESAPHDLCHEMDSARRAETLSLEIVALEKVEHLDHRHTTRRGRRHGDNLVATVRASKRFTLYHAIVAKILECHPWMAGVGPLHAGDYQIGRFAFIEISPAIFDHSGECLC